MVTGAVLTGDGTDPRVHSEAAEHVHEPLPELLEPPVEPTGGIGVVPHVVDDEGAVGVGNGATTGRPDQRLEPGGAGTRDGVRKARKPGVAPPEHHDRGRGPVHPHHLPDLTRARAAYQCVGERELERLVAGAGRAEVEGHGDILVEWRGGWFPVGPMRFPGHTGPSPQNR